MKYLYIFVSTVTIWVLVPLILEIVRAKSSGLHRGTIVMKYPLFYKIVSCIGFALISVILIIMIYHIEPRYIFLLVFYIIFYIATTWLVLTSINWRLEFREELVFRNFLGIPKKYKYSEITKITTHYGRNHTADKYTIYIGKRKIIVEYVVTNFNAFSHNMNKKLKKAKSTIQFEQI